MAGGTRGRASLSNSHIRVTAVSFRSMLLNRIISWVDKVSFRILRVKSLKGSFTRVMIEKEEKEEKEGKKGEKRRKKRVRRKKKRKGGEKRRDKEGEKEG